MVDKSKALTWTELRVGAVVWSFYLEWDHGTRNAAAYREKFAIYPSLTHGISDSR